MLPGLANAWWNEEWSYRKEIVFDTSTDGANIVDELNNATVLVRLHTGNFGYFLDVLPKAEDVRFIANDDVTPLKFHVERFDPVNEMALIWVQVPKLQPVSKKNKMWMYYGNTNAVAGDDRPGTFVADEVLVYHFDTADTVPQDATAYGHHASQFNGEFEEGSMVGRGALFNGSGALIIPDSPALAVDTTSGWSISSWIRTGQAQQAVIMERGGETGTVQLLIDGHSVYVRLTDVGGQVIETAHNASLMPDTWHHVALLLKSGRVSLYLDGKEVSYLEAALPEISGPMSIGAGAVMGRGEGASGNDGVANFSGALDELRISRIAQPDAYLQAIYKGQGVGASLLMYGEDGAQDEGGSEPSYFVVTMQNVTVDGWVVIVFLAIMAAISWVVMASKGIVIKRIRKDNSLFQDQFRALGADSVDNLDAEESAVEKQMQESPVLMALSGNHAHFESSTLYRIYHAGVQEMHHRIPKTIGAQAVDLSFSSQAINAIQATMDSVLTRENQKLNSQMVLLTIAISGGPFLGLLGTVVGVMITFAAIAASGDVNVNAIAPGIAAALVATVAGLAVAIPALFGYNYLGSRIKEISADMRVFVDEFIAKIAEQHS